jgi:hypothetical protein
MLVSILPLMESLARDTKIAASPGDITAFLGMVQNSKFAGDVRVFGLSYHDPPELTVSGFV